MFNVTLGMSPIQYVQKPPRQALLAAESNHNSSYGNGNGNGNVQEGTRNHNRHRSPRQQKFVPDVLRVTEEDRSGF